MSVPSAARSVARAIRSSRYALRRRLLQAAGVSVGARVRVDGQISVFTQPDSRISVADGVVLNSTSLRNTLEARGPVILRCAKPGACIYIGQDSGITSATISSTRSIRIGARVLIGAGAVITDSDHHVIDPYPQSSRRNLGLPQSSATDAVVIGDDAFIGARSIILKGVTVGQGAVVGAGSVVSRDVEPYTVVAGNPARTVRRLKGAEK